MTAFYREHQTPMANKTLTIATRKSPLALWQAEHIQEQLQKLHPQLTVNLLPMTTSGDRFLKDKLLAMDGKGMFVKELEEALLDGRADIAVHSMKDVPARFPAGLKLATICHRASPFDALVSKERTTFQELKSAAIIGTSSLRRQSQLLAARPDLNIKLIRGNIHTRLKKLAEEDYDAIILAEAGLQRMNMQENISEILPDHLMLPACGQGALGIECREDDEECLKLLAPLHDQNTAICVQTERRVNALLGGNCHVPLAVFCEISPSNQLRLRARVLSADGQTLISAEKTGEINHSDSLANECAAILIENGAEQLLKTETP